MSSPVLMKHRLKPVFPVRARSGIPQRVLVADMASVSLVIVRGWVIVGTTLWPHRAYRLARVVSGVARRVKAARAMKRGGGFKSPASLHRSFRSSISPTMTTSLSMTMAQLSTYGVVDFPS